MAEYSHDFSDTLNDVDRSLNSTFTDVTQPASIHTDSGKSVKEIVHSNLPDEISSCLRLNELDASLRRICYKYEIKLNMVERLQKLGNFEIVIVCDDSGSMTTPIDGTQGTRWDELRSIVKVVVDIGVIFDTNGVDIYFLNRDPFLKVKDLQRIDQAFEMSPIGYTPLVPVLSRIFELQLARPGREKKLLVFVATDGEPTDDDGNPNIPALERIMREKRRADTTYVSFLLCTNDPNGVKYLEEWDRTMENVDVTSDFCQEREKIRRCRRESSYAFSRGDYIVKALLGAIDPQMDALNDEA